MQRLLDQFGEKMLLRLLEAQGVTLLKNQEKQLLENARERKRDSMTSFLTYWGDQISKLVSQDNEWEARDKATRQRNTAPTPGGKDASKQRSRDDKVAVEKAMYINNAGLILLNPFMSRFLQLHDAVSDKEVKDVNLATVLLQSLVTGQKTTAEWELVLPKILMGHPVAAPLESVSLESTHLLGGEELITAAVKHWSALGNTTVEGFRANFLQREGMLVARGYDWHLTVQKAPYDMLLDTLPWGISIIKLPWMNGVLQVDWG